MTIDQLMTWYRSEFDRRTVALERGEGRIDWVDPGTRVSFAEVCRKAEELGVEMSLVELRLLVDAFGKRAKP